MSDVSVGSAMSHFRNTRGPGAFVWKYLLAYSICMAIFTTVNFFLESYLMGSLSGDITETMEDPDAAMAYAGRNALYVLLILPISAIFVAVFEASALRRYTRFEGFSLKFGADELRLIVVYLCWVLTAFLTFLIVVIPVSLAATMMASAMTAVSGNLFVGAVVGLTLFALYVGGFIFYVWVLLRFSPASAMTIRDRKIVFLPARKITKGHVWSLLGAYFLTWLIGVAVMTVVYAAIFGYLGSELARSGSDLNLFDPVAMEGLMSNPVYIRVMTIASILTGPIYAIFHFAFLGIPAKVAVADKSWADNPDHARVFD